MIKVSGTFCLCAAMTAGILFAEPQRITAQNQSWDTSFVPKDTFFFAGLNVEGLLRLEEEDSDLLKRLKPVFESEAHLKVDELRQVQFLLGGKEFNSDGDSFEVKMIFEEPQEWKGLIDTMFGGVEMNEAEFDGKKYFQSTLDYTPSVYIADDRIMVVAKEDRLKKLMENESGEGSIVDMVSEAEGNAHAFVAFEQNDQLNAFMREATAELQGLPFDLADIAAEARNATATVMLDSNEPFIATIQSKDAEGAERLQRAAEAIIALGKIGVPQGRKMMETIPDFGDARAIELRKEFLVSAKKGLDVAEAALDDATVVVKEDKVDIKMTVKGGAVDGARAIAEMMLYGMEMRSQLVEPAFDDISDELK